MSLASRRGRAGVALFAGLVGAACAALPAGPLRAQDWPKVTEVARQPLVAATERLVEALEFVGAPLPAADRKALDAALADTDPVRCAVAVQKVLDPHCLCAVHVNPESRVKVIEGPAKKELVQQGWRSFLVKVHNEAGINPALVAESPHAAAQYRRSSGSPAPPLTITPGDAAQRFLDLAMVDRQPLKPTLSGLELEYRIVQLYSRDVGKREAKLSFHIGQGTQDIGFRNAVPILFECVPAVEVVLGVKDADGRPAMASFLVRDWAGRVVPNPARRLAPDFFFHPQVYRADGESLHLPPGEYTVQFGRGPEHLVETRKLTVPAGVASHRAAFELKRWIHPLARGWVSGDHHVHAAGCAHYENPTEGVTPGDMMRHILGEDLNVGCVLSWGPCWYAQKQFFEGKTSALSKPRYLMRYDVEVSGFPSSHAGHLCLLRLKEDDYPGTKVLEDWPSWTLPILQWGQSQGGVVGYSHSGWGLALPDYAKDGSRVPTNYRAIPEGWDGRAADVLPDFAMPPFDGIGANEYVVTAAHGACDFISAVDTPAVWELNIWYHTLNCGLTSRISGETDFPCIYGDKVGLGRIYVKLPQEPNSPIDFDAWIDGLKAGRSYCGDGLSHVFDLQAGGVSLGEPGAGGRPSVVALAKPGTVSVSCDVAALLEEKITPETESIRTRRLDQKPYWHVERARIAGTRKVPVELVVDGFPVERRELVADGHVETLKFEVPVRRSSWLAVRIFPTVHTNPIWVEVDGKPVRADRRSAEWCRKAVDVCWEKKKGRIRPTEIPAAQKAYDTARTYYERVLTEIPAE